MTKGVVMNKPNKQMRDKPSKPIISDKQRGIGVIELLVAVASVGAAVVGAALSGPKLPPVMSD